MNLRRKRNNGIKSSSRKKSGGIPEGPFSMNWDEYPDSPTIPAGMGLVDAHDVIPLREDRLGIVDGKLALMEAQGPDNQHFDYSGWRGAVYRDTKTLSNNVYGTGVAGLHFNMEGKNWAIASWYNGFIGYLELGVIGRNQQDFAYLDATWHPPASDWTTARIRSKDGYASVEVNGEIWCGPVAIPSDLVGSTKHGAQLDIHTLAEEGVGYGPNSVIGFDDSPMGNRPNATLVSVGTSVNTASSTTINIPYPSSIQAGDILVAIVATKVAGNISASGWTYRSTSFGSNSGGIAVRIISKIATGSESGDLTVTKTSGGASIMAGVMYCTRHLSITQPFFSSTHTTIGSSVTSISSPATQVLGIKRAVLWVCAADADTTITLPAGWSPSSTGASGQAIKLTIGKADDLESASFMSPLPYNAYRNDHLPVQTGTLGTTTNAVAGIIQFHPTVAPL